MDFRGALSQYLNTTKNYIHHSSYVIMLNKLFLILFPVHESWQPMNETSSMKAAERGAIKGSWKEERLEKWYNHFNDLLRRAPVLAGKYTDGDLPTVYSLFSLLFKVIPNICFGWKR